MPEKSRDYGISDPAFQLFAATPLDQILAGYNNVGAGGWAAVQNYEDEKKKLLAQYLGSLGQSNEARSTLAKRSLDIEELDSLLERGVALANGPNGVDAESIGPVRDRLLAGGDPDTRSLDQLLRLRQRQATTAKTAGEAQQAQTANNQVPDQKNIGLEDIIEGRVTTTFRPELDPSVLAARAREEDELNTITRTIPSVVNGQQVYDTQRFKVKPGENAPNTEEVIAPSPEVAAQMRKTEQEFRDRGVKGTLVRRKDGTVWKKYTDSNGGVQYVQVK